MERFTRQKGLVRQGMVENLKIAIEPNVEFPSGFKEALSLIAEHLGVSAFPSSSSEVDYTIHWASGVHPEHQAVNTIHACYGEEGVFLDGSRPNKPCHPMYDTSLATICASLVWSEVLRRSECFLPIEVPKVSVSVNVRVNENALHSNLNNINVHLEGHKTSTNIRETNDGSSHRRVLLRLDEDDPIAKQLIERLRIDTSSGKINPQYPVIALDLPPPTKELSGHITVVGAGGLGTWCLHNLVAGIKKSKRASIGFLVFDKDLEVEEHNLNRQVLFTKSDVGSPKILATRRWLQSKLPGASIEVAWELTDSMALDSYLPAKGGLDLGSLLESEALNDTLEMEPLTVEETQQVLRTTDQIIGCLDAMRPRVLADFLSAKINQPYINGGVKNFVSEYREFAHTNLVERYGPQVAQDRQVFSCQEDGEVPMTSIVFTNAYAGAFQAIAALQRLAGRSQSTIESTYWNSHTNEVFVTKSSDATVERQASVKELEHALWPKPSVSTTKLPEESAAGV